jgi:hypothetical protein
MNSRPKNSGEHPPDDGTVKNCWRSLPMLKRYPVLAGALAGVVLRLIFSGPAGSRWSPMVGAFIFLAPIFVGMLTVYLAERQRRRTWLYYFWAPSLATGLFVAGTLLLLIEGWICAIVIVPMFAVLGGAAGLVMGALCRGTNWPRASLRCAAALPIALAIIGPLIPTPSDIGEIERSILIDAPASTIWLQINDVRNIEREEMADALALRIGVPRPLSGVTRDTGDGRVRTTHWDKRVHFDEVIEDWQPDRYLRWTYRFSPDSFPRRALDDHVVIGGHYFDLVDTSFSLQPVAGGAATLVTTRVRYRISTQFNFYANWVAQILIGNLIDVGLRLYRSRSEQAAHTPGDSTR